MISRNTAHFKTIACLKSSFVFIMCVVTGWILFTKTPVLSPLFGFKTEKTVIQPEIVYQDASKVPAPAKSRLWPEERFLNDPRIDDIRQLADPRLSILQLEGKPVVEIGGTVQVTVVLYDGFKQRKKMGGDLIRVWMREPSLNASANGKVVDNNDGSYTAILTAFWVGRPEIVAAIIAPREVTAFSLKRRYVLPNILMNTAVFVHPEDETIVEETPCNYEPQIPGYSLMCNFTEENYLLPWYCGKPRTFRLSCSDWTMAGARNLWQLGIEQQYLTPLELDLVSLQKKAMILQEKIKIRVNGADSQQTSLTSCNKTSPSVTWMKGSPTGYLYNRKWYSKFCKREQEFGETFKQCLKNTNLVLIGDSTMRQMFLEFERIMPCKWVTDKWSSKGKHRPVACADFNLNFTVSYSLHQLPFCTQDTPRQYFKSFRAYANEIYAEKRRTIMVINLFAHFLNTHSHVYIESLQRLHKDLTHLLTMDPNVTVMIKGPHAYSFARNSDSVMWMPDMYAIIYQDYLYEMFHDLDDRVIYLDALDMTVSTEQWHIHAEDYIVGELALNILGYIC